MDGSVVIPLDNTAGWIRLPGATGLEMAPFDVVSSSIPGVAGSVVRDVRTLERPVFIPVYGYSDTSYRDFKQLKDQLRTLIDPTTGSFKLVGMTERSIREMIVTYESGFEGADGGDNDGLSWIKAGLRLTAHFPFARAREDRTLEFRVTSTPTVFMGVAGGTDAPWPTALSSTSVIGTGMTVTIDSEVPVYPELTLIGEMTSFAGTASQTVITPSGAEMILTDQEWSVDVPLGVGAGETFTMVTDPRERSIRLDGAQAAGLVERGSKLRPFYPGQNTLNVVAPGGTEATRIILSWRDLYWSIW
jgi:hypothetical protein